MKIAGYEILREKGDWVEERQLYSPLFYQTIIEKLEHVIRNPDWPGYSVRYNLRQKRIRIDNIRVYVQIYPDSLILAVLAVVVKGAIAADNIGSLTGRFINYLSSHRDFREDRFIPLLSIGEYESRDSGAIDKTEYLKTTSIEIPEPSFNWGPTITHKELSEKEATELLLGDQVVKPMNQISANLMGLIEKALPGDRVLIPLPPGSDNWEAWMIRSAQSSIKYRLAVMDKKYSVRYDDISRKFILIPPNKIQTFALNHIGRISKISDPVEAQDGR